MNALLAMLLIVGVAIGGIVFLSFAAGNPGGGTPVSSNGALTLPPLVDGKQDVFLKATQYGTYNPNYILVKKDTPVRIHYSADALVGCGREVIFPEFKQRKMAPQTGETLIEFIPTKTGKFPFHCSMQMFRGTIEVVE